MYVTDSVEFERDLPILFPVPLTLQVLKQILHEESKRNGCRRGSVRREGRVANKKYSGEEYLKESKVGRVESFAESNVGVEEVHADSKE